MPDLALVTGANRGIGLEIVRQLAERGYTVILGARDLAKGEAAADELGLDAVVPRTLDVTDSTDIEALRDWVAETYGHLDVLVNNAAINYDSDQGAVGVAMDDVQRTFETNTLGAWQMAQAFLPLLRESTHGRIANVSSGSGSLAKMGGGTPAYSVSKTALNALTRLLAGELRPDGILVNSVCPGWVRTDMGGSNAPRSVEEGAASVVWAATLPDDGPTGGFFRDGKELPW